MKTSKIKAVINGVEVICNKEDFGAVLSALQGKTTPSTDSPVQQPFLIKGSAMRDILEGIKADSADDFVLKALQTVKARGQTRGLHTVFSGLNDIIRRRYNVNPVEISNGLIESGLIKGRPAPRGFSLTLAE